MKKTNYFLLTLSALTMVMSACGTSSGNSGGERETFEFTETVTSLEQGDTFRIKTDSARPLTYSSSNTDAVTVDGSGLVEAVGKGSSDIAVSNGKVTKSFTVTVVTDFVPELKIDDSDELRIMVNQKYDLEPTISYKGNDDLSFTGFTFTSESTDVLTVDSEGIINAVSAGESNVTVSARYRYYNVTESISVTVVNSGYIYFRSDTVELSLLNEGSFCDNYQLDPVVIENGSAVKDPTIEWSCDDNGVISFDNGKITALKPGTAAVRAKYGSYETSCSVRVYKPNIDTGLQFGCEMDKGLVLPDYELSDFSAEKITAVYYGGEDVTNDLKTSDGKTVKTIDKDKVIGSPEERKFVIETAKASYTVGITLYNAVIRSVDDFMAVTDKLSVFSVDSSNLGLGNYFDGYVVLDEDVDFQGASYDGIANPYAGKPSGSTSTFYPGLANCFHGIFDGRNHTVSNIVFSTRYSSLVGGVGASAAVRNVNIVNSRVSSCAAASVASNTTGSVTFDNINVSGILDVDGIDYENSYYSSGLFVSSLPSSSARIRNCVIELQESFNTSKKAGYFGYAYTTHKDASFFENVVTIGPSDILYGYCDNDDWANAFVHATSREGIEHYLYRYEYDISVDIANGYVIDEDASTAATCTKSGTYVLTKDGEEDKIYVINPLGHDIVDGHCTHDGCQLRILEQVYADGDVKEGFDFSSLSSADLLGVTADGMSVETSDGKVSYSKGDVGMTVSYLCTFSDDTIIPVDVTIYTLLIKTEDDLAAANSYLTVSSSDSPLTTGSFKLANDIVMTKDWDFSNSIGLVSGSNHKWSYSYNRAFGGTFDGGNHTISNFNINVTTEGEECYGLFFSTSDGALIKNLTIEGSTNVGFKRNHGGFFVGKAYGGTFENITLKADMKNDGYDKAHGAGLFLGFLTDSAYNGDIVMKNVTIINDGTDVSGYKYANPLGINSDDYQFQNPGTCADASITMTDVTLVGYTLLYYDGKPASGAATGYYSVSSLPDYIKCNNVISETLEAYNASLNK